MDKVEFVARRLCIGDPDTMVQTMHFRDLGELGTMGYLGDPLIPAWRRELRLAERAIAAVRASDAQQSDSAPASRE
jgi:hypothetical protein